MLGEKLILSLAILLISFVALQTPVAAPLSDELHSELWTLKREY